MSTYKESVQKQSLNSNHSISNITIRYSKDYKILTNESGFQVYIPPGSIHDSVLRENFAVTTNPEDGTRSFSYHEI